MSKKTIGKIVLTLAAVFAAGSVSVVAGKAAAVQYRASLLQNASAEKLLFCETDYDIIDAKHS